MKVEVLNRLSSGPGSLSSTSEVTAVRINYRKDVPK